MKTKSIKQIYAQADRIIDGMANASWDGKEYENHANLVQRIEKVADICDNYVNNIYRYFGVDSLTCSASVANEIFIKQTPTQVYTGNNN